VQLLEDEITDTGVVLARVTASQATLQSQVAQLEETKARLLKDLHGETKSKERAQVLIKEYERGIEKRCIPSIPWTCIHTAQDSAGCS
jgi:septation ring formation regulator EzrA